jgi:hypothetical protein
MTEVFLVASAGEGACPIERQAAVPRMPLGALVRVLSVLHFREIMTLAPFDEVGGPEPSTCTVSGL